MGDRLRARLAMLGTPSTISDSGSCLLPPWIQQRGDDRNGTTTAVPGDFARPGHTAPVGVYGHLVSERAPTEMATEAELREFAAHQGITDVGVEELIGYARDRSVHSG